LIFAVFAFFGPVMVLAGCAVAARSASPELWPEAVDKRLTHHPLERLGSCQT
jgi:hypothetical protein